MHEPDTGIVGFERDDDVAITGEEDNVPAGRVLVRKVQLRWISRNCCVRNLGQDRKVMPMEMDLAGVNITLHYGWGWHRGLCKVQLYRMGTEFLRRVSSDRQIDLFFIQFSPGSINLHRYKNVVEHEYNKYLLRGDLPSLDPYDSLAVRPIADSISWCNSNSKM